MTDNLAFNGTVVINPNVAEDGALGNSKPKSPQVNVVVLVNGAVAAGGEECRGTQFRARELHWRS